MGCEIITGTVGFFIVIIPIVSLPVWIVIAIFAIGDGKKIIGFLSTMTFIFCLYFGLFGHLFIPNIVNKYGC